MLTCQLRSSVGASSPHISARLRGPFALAARQRDMAQHPLIISGLNGMINADDPGSSWEGVWKAGLHPGEVRSPPAPSHKHQPWSPCLNSILNHCRCLRTEVRHRQRVQAAGEAAAESGRGRSAGFRAWLRVSARTSPRAGLCAQSSTFCKHYAPCDTCTSCKAAAVAWIAVRAAQSRALIPQPWI